MGAVRADVLATLGLPDVPDSLLAGHAHTLDRAYREIGGRLAANTEVCVDEHGKIHLIGVKAVKEPPSLVNAKHPRASGSSASRRIAKG
jgi:hypothetical protein